jgi:hypothetical protein
VLLAVVTVVCLGSAFFLAKDMQFLMPGRLASVHGAIEKCSTCHTASGDGKLSWIHSLVAGDPLADSKACLTCHKMPDTAFNPHGTSVDVLAQSTRRLAKIAAGTPAPQWAKAQSAAFPTHDVVERGLYCATCHQEHQGASFDLARVSNEQCQTCHVVKFDSFDGNHPKFEDYPFKKRTPIIYDHAGHFGKHFPEVAKKEPARRIPATCSSCHNSRADRRIMAVAPFEQTCSGCHLDQITGKERVSGPKGIAFLTLPGLDLQTLKKRNAPIGEWPAASEAELTPFMKVMISRNQRGRALIKAVAGLNLQDLSDASDGQIRAVTELAWEIKRLFHALIAGKASDALGNLNIHCGAKLSATLIADLTASIPRDVVISAQQQWLPSLGAEMADRQAPSDQEQGCWLETVGGWTTTIAEPELALDKEAPGAAKPDKLARASPKAEAKDAPGAVIKSLGVDPYGRLIKGREDEAGAAKTEGAKSEVAQPEAAAAKTDTAANAKPGKEALAPDRPPQAKTADQTDDLLNLTAEELGGIKDAEKAARPGGAAVRGFTAYAGDDGGREALSATEESAPAMKAGLKGAEPERAAGKAGVRIAQAGGKAAPAAGKPPQAKAADQTDDLLNPTEDELRGIPAPIKDAEKAARPEGAVPKPAAANAKPDTAAPAAAAAKVPATAPPDAPADTASAAPQAKAAPVINIDSDVDPESWAVYGGWYRQDYTIFYRPTGHKDKFIYSWLFLTGPQAPKGDASPAAAVFDVLTGKDAQGSCTKCHSVDNIKGKGRVINFSPPSVASRQGRFTQFIHEPHFGVLEQRGCLTCHSLEKGRPYLKSYEQGDPKIFMSNFGAVKKELCQTCHTSSMARQDCLLCHKYHVNGVITPSMSTKIPAE